MLTEYKIEVVKQGPRKVDIKITIGKDVFPSLALLTFEDKGTEGIKIVEEERNGHFIPPEIVEKARKLAGNIMLAQRTRRYK